MIARAAYSIGRQLSIRLLLLTMTVLGLLCAAIYVATWTLHERSQQRILAVKVGKLEEVSRGLLPVDGGRFLQLLGEGAGRRSGSRLELFNVDGSVFYQDPMDETHVLSEHRASRRFVLHDATGRARLNGTFAIDIEADVKILRSLAIVLVLATLVGGLVASFIALLAVRHGLRPLRLITRQTQQISAGRLSERLSLKQPVAELQPWVEQFNGLMDRMEGSYAQLEAFNADVAHELRTPLTSLIGKTEVALTRERSVAELNETLASNLEELHRIADLVNDMLFLSTADRGAAARLGQPVHLRAVIGEVIEFHEAVAAEKRVDLEVVGDTSIPIDEPLFKRAISNLLGNALRYSPSGTAVRVLVSRDDDMVRVAVQNAGTTIAPEHLPRLFDRFYRADASRQGSGAHHGLGLAIVAAIARMHGGRTFAESDATGTRVGFTVQAGEADEVMEVREVMAESAARALPVAAPAVAAAGGIQASVTGGRPASPEQHQPRFS